MTHLQNITSAFDARAAHARANDNEGLARKWEDERAHFITAAFVTFFEARPEIDICKMINSGAIYATQKVRKIVQAIVTETRARVDGYTRCTLQNARVLADKGTDFTFALHNAALSKSCSATHSTRLANRLASSANTATTQSSSTRMALAALGCVIFYKTAGDENALRVDFDNEIVAAIM